MNRDLKFLAFFLSCIIAFSIVANNPIFEEPVEAASLSPIQERIVLNANAAYKKWTISNIPNAHAGNWCGDYVNHLLEVSYSNCGYTWSNYIPTSDMSSSTSISKTISNDTRWSQYYSWSKWEWNGKKGEKTDNRNMYSPQVGDIVNVAWDRNYQKSGSPIENGDNEPDHVGIIVEIKPNGDIVVSEGNTSTYSPYVGTFTYSRQNISVVNSSGAQVTRSYNGEYCYRRSGGTIVCIVRPIDPTSGRSSIPGTQWTAETDFYAAILRKDTWSTIGLQSNNNVAIISESDAHSIWRFEKQSNDTYVIRNAYDGSVLDVSEASSANGANVYGYSQYVGASNQQWKIYECPDGYVLQAAHGDKVLDCTGGYSNVGTNIEM